MCVECYELAGERQRYKMLKYLAKGERTVGELVEHTGLRQPTVTHHLQLMERAKLLVMNVHGRSHVYRLNQTSECFSDCGLLKGITT